MQTLQDTRELLIVTATKLYAVHGIHWVSFQMIATEVGVSQPSLYKHFADKDALILACAMRAAEQGRTLIDKGIDPFAPSDVQLRQYIEGNLIWAEKQSEQAAIILAIYYFAYNSPEIKKMFTALNWASEQRLMVRITAGEREGLWGKNVVTGKHQKTEHDRIALQARALHSLLMGEMIKMVQCPREMSRRERLDVIWSAFQGVLGAGTTTFPIAVRSKALRRKTGSRPDPSAT